MGEMTRRRMVTQQETRLNVVVPYAEVARIAATIANYQPTPTEEMLACGLNDLPRDCRASVTFVLDAFAGERVPRVNVTQGAHGAAVLMDAASLDAIPTGATLRCTQRLTTVADRVIAITGSEPVALCLPRPHDEFDTVLRGPVPPSSLLPVGWDITDRAAVVEVSIVYLAAQHSRMRLFITGTHSSDVSETAQVTQRLCDAIDSHFFAAAARRQLRIAQAQRRLAAMRRVIGPLQHACEFVYLQAAQPIAIALRRTLRLCLLRLQELAFSIHRRLVQPASLWMRQRCQMTYNCFCRAYSWFSASLQTFNGHVASAMRYVWRSVAPHVGMVSRQTTLALQQSFHGARRMTSQLHYSLLIPLLQWARRYLTPLADQYSAVITDASHALRGLSSWACTQFALSIQQASDGARRMVSQLRDSLLIPLVQRVCWMGNAMWARGYFAIDSSSRCVGRLYRQCYVVGNASARRLTSSAAVQRIAVASGRCRREVSRQIAAAADSCVRGAWQIAEVVHRCGMPGMQLIVRYTCPLRMRADAAGRKMGNCWRVAVRKCTEWRRAAPSAHARSAVHMARPRRFDDRHAIS